MDMLKPFAADDAQLGLTEELADKIRCIPIHDT